MPDHAAASGRRVAVTGLGAVSALGWGVRPLWEALRAGRTGLGPFSRFDHSRQRTHVAGEVPAQPKDGPRRRRQRERLTYCERFALFAAFEALEQAGFEARLEDRGAGVFFGTSTAGLLESEWFLDELWRGGGRPRLGLMASHTLNSPGDCVARHLRVTGPVETISSACASSTLAIGAAVAALRAGEVDLAIAGGADCLCAITYSGFNSLRSVDEAPCRPFRQGRSGLSLGEGAGVLMLETVDHAVARGARVRAELLGAGSSCDANHMTAPHPQGIGAAQALAHALEDSGVPAEGVGFINAHGTGTPLNDASEWAAFVRTFGEPAGRLPVSATKSIVGHLLGASGAIEAVATVLCLEAGEAHPAAGTGPIDPAIPVDLVLDQPRRLHPERAAVSTSLGFGGANAALVLRRYPDEVM